METMEGGGEGVIDLAAKLDECEAGGEDAEVWRLGVGTSAILTGRERVELTDSGSGDLSMMWPLASMVSLLGLFATTTVLHTASSRTITTAMATMMVSTALGLHPVVQNLFDGRFRDVSVQMGTTDGVGNNESRNAIPDFFVLHHRPPDVVE